MCVCHLAEREMIGGSGIQAHIRSLTLSLFLVSLHFRSLLG